MLQLTIIFNHKFRNGDFDRVCGLMMLWRSFICFGLNLASPCNKSNGPALATGPCSPPPPPGRLCRRRTAAHLRRTRTPRRPCREPSHGITRAAGPGRSSPHRQHKLQTTRLPPRLHSGRQPRPAGSPSVEPPIRRRRHSATPVSPPPTRRQLTPPQVTKRPPQRSHETARDRRPDSGTMPLPRHRCDPLITHAPAAPAPWAPDDRDTRPERRRKQVGLRRAVTPVVGLAVLC